MNAALCDQANGGLLQAVVFVLKFAGEPKTQRSDQPAIRFIALARRKMIDHMVEVEPFIPALPPRNSWTALLERAVKGGTRAGCIVL